MAFTNTKNKEAYTATEGQTSFQITFQVYSPGELEVYVDDVRITTGYSVTLPADPSRVDNDAYGEVVFESGLINGQKVLLYRVPLMNQESKFALNGAFPSSVVEKILDRHAQVNVWQDERLSRTISFRVSSTTPSMEMPDPEASKSIVWNAAGDGIENGPTADEIANAQTYAENAATSETNAGNSAQVAQTARAGAEAAQTATENARDTAIANITAQETTSLAAVTAEGVAAVGAVNSAGTTQVSAVNSAGATQVGNVETEGNAQVARVQAVSGELAAISAREIGGTAYQSLLGFPLPPSLDFKAYDYKDEANGAPSIAAFARASTAYQVNAAGLLESVAADVIRHDYDPVTGEYLGWLIGESRTNLLTYSEEFDNASWFKNNVTVTANATTGPDGNISADLIVANSAMSPRFYQPVTVSAATEYSFSVYLKRYNNDWIMLDLYDGVVNGQRFWVNLATGVTGITASIGSGLAVGFTEIEECAGGWFRAGLVVTTATNTTLTCEIALVDANGSVSGVNGAGVYASASSCEEGPFPTSYIKTTTAAATRAADVLHATSSNFTYNQSEGTFVFVWQNAQGAAPYVFEMNDGTLSNRILAYVSGSNLNVLVIDGGTVTADTTLPVQNGVNKVAVAYKENAVQFALNGTPSIVDANCTIPSGLTSLWIGCSNGNNNFLNGEMTYGGYFPRALSQSNLQIMTS